MVLDTLSSETPNIKDLSVDIQTEELESRFNPVEELGEKFIETVLSEIEFKKTRYFETYNQPEKYDQNRHYVDAANTAAQLATLKVLSPRRVEEFKIDDSTYQFLSILMNPIPGNLHSEYLYLYRVTYLKMLFPEIIESTREYQEIKLDIGSTLMGVKQEEANNLFNFFYCAKLLRLDIPEGIITEEDWDSRKSEFDIDHKSKNWENVIFYLAEFKVLNQERFSQLKITKEEWEEMMTYFRSGGGQDATNADYSTLRLENTLRMAIIAAKEAIINETGMHLINKTPDQFLQEPVPPMPEQRSF